MAIGLPAEAAGEVHRRALAAGMRCAAAVYVLGAIALLLRVQLAFPERMLWPGLPALVVLGLLIVLTRASGSVPLAAAYLVAGSAALLALAFVLYTQFATVGRVSIVLSFAQIALILAAAALGGVVMRLTTAALALVAALAAPITAAAVTGGAGATDPTVLIAFGSVVVLYAAVVIAARLLGRVPATLTRAARDEDLTGERQRVEAEGSALLHDTVLGDLAALASAPEGALALALRERVDRDLQTLRSTEWLRPRISHRDGQRGWRASAVAAAVREAEALGLEVEVTGDRAAVALLSAESDASLGAAVRQCLVNVVRHAGVDRAEVAVYNGDGVNVMVVDAGRGFNEQDTASDRLGLRHSVRRRLELAGGETRIWSAPGLGTTVLLRMPVSPGAPAGAAVAGARS